LPATDKSAPLFDGIITVAQNGETVHMRQPKPGKFKKLNKSVFGLPGYSSKVPRAEDKTG